MFQGGGGTEGAVPPATGVAGTLSPTLAHGWSVASQDGGHENKDLPHPFQFFLDPQAVVDHAYGSIEATTQTAKFLIDAYYGQSPNRSYFVGCSTGGRQGMVFSQNFSEAYGRGDRLHRLHAPGLGKRDRLQVIDRMRSTERSPSETRAEGLSTATIRSGRVTEASRLAQGRFAC
jgi:hypothetical protein